MTDLDAWVPLAEIARPHGVKGELRLKLFNKDSDALLGQDEVLVRMKDGVEHEVSVDRARRADDAILMKLHSVDDRNKADELRGALVCVRRRDFAPPDDGEFYAVDVMGAEVRVNGVRLGAVVEIVDYPTVQAMVVRADDTLGDWEIPLTESYVSKVDTTARVVEVLTLDELERAAPKKPKKEKEKRNWGKDWRKPEGAKAGDASDASETAPAGAEKSEEPS